MNEKKYHIDFEPASAREIIIKAREYDDEFNKGFILQSSIAANILRKHGHKVGDVTEIPKSNE